MLQGQYGLGIMIVEGKHANVGQGIFASDVQEGSLAEKAIVRTTLSSWIRNHRTNIKKEALKRDANGEIIKPMKNAIHVTINEVPQSADDVQKLLDELIKNKKDNDTPHIRRLLKLTLQKRRKWLENEATSINEVLSTYIPLKNIESLLFEFYNLKNLTKEHVFTRILSMFRTLGDYFDMEIIDENCKITIIKNLCDNLSKRKPKDIDVLFTVEQTDSLKDLIPAQGESPRSVIFQTTSGEIVGALLLADQNSMKIENPSMKKIIASLLASYYCYFPRLAPLHLESQWPFTPPNNINNNDDDVDDDNNNNADDNNNDDTETISTDDTETNSTDDDHDNYIDREMQDLLLQNWIAADGDESGYISYEEDDDDDDDDVDMLQI
ncbi:hypothetical protein PV327_004068 [Microctonus hyperodae]|uniref:Uncharacterized protein n=1 Tax=Microctonus hyperodae TaxID=165561 RepID=A0AA39FBM6_MICHY|nr:hypothetical protein PV327_004068 [Microctonus hyperodae]